MTSLPEVDEARGFGHLVAMLMRARSLGRDAKRAQRSVLDAYALSYEAGRRAGIEEIAQGVLTGTVGVRGWSRSIVAAEIRAHGERRRRAR